MHKSNRNVFSACVFVKNAWMNEGDGIDRVLRGIVLHGWLNLP